MILPAVITLMDAQEHYLCIREHLFEIPKLDQVISSPIVAQIGSIGSYRTKQKYKVATKIHVS